MNKLSCRFCGTPEWDSSVSTEGLICLSTFDEHEQSAELNLLQKVNACLPIEISESNGLSTKICTNCAVKTLSTYEFIQMIRDTQKRNTIITVNTNVINEDLIKEKIKRLPNINFKKIPFKKEPSPIIELKNCNNNESTNVSQVIEKLQKLSNRLTISRIKSPTTELFEFFDVKSTKDSTTIELDRDDDYDDHAIAQQNNNDIDNDNVNNKNHIDNMINSDPKSELNNSNNNNAVKSTDVEMIDVMDLKYEYIETIEEHAVDVSDLTLIDQWAVDANELLPINEQKKSSEDYIEDNPIVVENTNNNNNKLLAKRTYATKRSNKCITLKMDEPPAFICTQCQKRFSSFELLKEHMNGVDCKTIPFKCDICEKVFETKKSFKQHTFHVHSERPHYVCDECGKTYTYSFNLENHKASMHDDMMPTNNSGHIYNCTVCSDQFTTQKDLLEHKSTHLKLSSVHLCDTCGKCCTSIEALRSHLRLHMDIRPFGCTFCSKTYRSRLTLTQHLHIHTGIKPFACVTCGKSFAKRESLVSHNRVHTGIPYSFDCTICPMKFTKPKKLNAHLKIHEPQNVV